MDGVLSDFEAMRKDAVSFDVCDVTEQLGFHWTDFYEIYIWGIFRKSVENFQISLKSEKNKVYFTWRTMYIYDSVSLNPS